MRTTKYLLFAALGVCRSIYCLHQIKAKEMRDDMEDKAMKNAKEWRKKLSAIGSSTTDTLADLKDLLSSEIEGLSDDARQRIESIVNGTTKGAAKMKRSVTNHA